MSKLINKYIFLFTRRRKRICIGTTFLMSLLFVTYQFIIYYMVSNVNISEKPDVLGNPIRGTHSRDQQFYTPINRTFTCFRSGEVINFKKVNDNYCDCADSTDEPGTNACPDGIFYCLNESPNKQYPKMVPSSKVNDGICDCCDGSEEYDNHVINNFERTKQTKMKHYLAPCPNVCQ